MNTRFQLLSVELNCYCCQKIKPIRPSRSPRMAEINYLGQLHHPNLVQLIGYCLEDDQRLLVYDFMSLGSLENHLFRRSSYFQPLSWNLRLKVDLGSAKGLAYLHSPDAKNYNAKLSDFGLAKDRWEKACVYKGHGDLRICSSTVHGYSSLD